MFLNGIENYMIPCVNKAIFGVECLGCGMQRAIVYLFSGQFAAAFKVYPAVFTIFLFAGFMVFDMFIKIKYSELIKTSLMIVNILIILISYAYKHFI